MAKKVVAVIKLALNAGKATQLRQWDQRWVSTALIL